MILRRVIEHVRTQNWTAVALDFVIVVFGVFIGIQVSNWNAARADRAMEATYLALLQRDLEATITDIESQIGFEQFQVRLANEAVPVIAEPASDVRRRKLGMILTQLGARRTLRIESPTFLDMQSSGRLGLISDPDLRDAIVSYFFHTQRWAAIVDKNNEQFVDQGFNKFTDDLIIGYWLWDEDVMRLAPPSAVRSIIGLRRERVDAQLLEAGGAVLASPADAPLWIEVKSRLGKRAAIAAANEGVAAAIRDETAIVAEKIAASLEGTN